MRLQSGERVSRNAVVYWTIDEVARDVWVVPGTLGSDAELASCLQKQISRWKFPKPENGEKVVARVTWLFE